MPAAPAPVTSLDELWLRVRQGDTIEVTTLGGEEVTGKFLQVSNEAVTMAVHGSRREIASGDVRRVTRAGNRYRSGALWGGALFGTMGVLVSASCSGGESDCGNALFVGMFMASSGALWGAAIGALIPKHPAVYERRTGTPSVLRVGPLLDSDRFGVAFSAAF